MPFFGFPLVCGSVPFHYMPQVLVATARSGRDTLPPSHPAVRHDLTHPSMPAAALAQLRRRLEMKMGRNVARSAA